MNLKNTNIILIGFMGCGKSTVGRELSQMLHYPLLDTDGEIEKRENRKITEIFATEGEEAFREMESALLRELSTAPPEGMIISCGGGIILREENRHLLKALGCVVWLRADAQLIYERTRKNKQRPILHTADPMQVIVELLEKRTPLYRDCAHIMIDVNGLNSRELAVGVCESVRYHSAS